MSERRDNIVPYPDPHTHIRRSLDHIAPRLPALPAWTTEMNREWSVIQVGNRVNIMTEKQEITDEGYMQTKQEFLRVQDFKTLLTNQTVPIGDKTFPVADLWLKHPERKTYRGMGMYPPPLKAPTDRYNLWRGFGVIEEAGGWPLLYRHFDCVLSGCDKLMLDYQLNWVAWGFQHLNEKPITSLLLVGDPGFGKGIVGHLLRGLYGVHGRYLHKKEQVVGKHNAHMANAMFCYVDEAFFGGDRAAAAALKPLITDPVIPVEPKFVDLYDVPNRLRLMFASNERHALHLDIKDRRIAAAECTPCWRNAIEQRSYFDALRHEISNGGRQAFLYDMCRWNLDSFDIRDIPATALKAEQQMLSLRSTEAWWHSVLSAGEPFWRPTHGSLRSDGGMVKDYVYARYTEWSRQQKNEYTDSHAMFWKKLRGMIDFREQRPREGDERVHYVWFPPLGEARWQFEHKLNLGVSLPWEG